jgi:hypothetical protein
VLNHLPWYGDAHPSGSSARQSLAHQRDLFIRVYSWLKIFWRFGLLPSVQSVVSVVACSPTNWCPSPTTAAREPARMGSQSRSAFFFSRTSLRHFRRRR